MHEHQITSDQLTHQQFRVLQALWRGGWAPKSMMALDDTRKSLALRMSRRECAEAIWAAVDRQKTGIKACPSRIKRRPVTAALDAPAATPTMPLVVTVPLTEAQFDLLQRWWGYVPAGLIGYDESYDSAKLRISRSYASELITEAIKQRGNKRKA